VGGAAAVLSSAMLYCASPYQPRNQYKSQQISMLCMLPYPPSQAQIHKQSCPPDATSRNRRKFCELRLTSQAKHLNTKLYPPNTPIGFADRMKRLVVGPDPEANCLPPHYSSSPSSGSGGITQQQPAQPTTQNTHATMKLKKRNPTFAETIVT